jgi:hypothetical protein
VTVWSEFQPLASIVLGDIFPSDELLNELSLTPRWQKPFEHIVDTARNELAVIADTIKGLGVEVIRPQVYPMNCNGEFSVPPLAVRDVFMIYGNRCIEGNEAFKNNQPRITSARAAYSQLEIECIPTDDVWYTGSFNDLETKTIDRPYLHTANILRCGNDMFVSKILGRTGNQLGLEHFKGWARAVNPAVRFHWVDTDEHLDGSIFLVRPGLMLSAIERHKLPEFFKNWTVIPVTNTSKSKHIYQELYAHRYKKLNPVIAEKYSWFLQCEPEETLFSLNALSIDENTVVFPGFDAELFSALEQHNVNCISVDMRAISFWDSGLHCCTNEIHRSGPLEDYS